MTPVFRTVVIWGLAKAALAAVGATPQKDDPVKLPPVVVEDSQPKAKVAISGWKEEWMAPGAIWKLDDPHRTQSFLFDEDHVVRTVFGTKGVRQEDGTIKAGFTPMRLKWRVEDEWLVFFDQENHRIEELKFVRKGWIWLTTSRKSGESLKFRMTKPPPIKPVNIRKS